jgi:hypothetical protein
MSAQREAARKRFDLRQDIWRVVALLGTLLILNAGFYAFLNLPRLRALSDLATGRDEGRRSVIDITRSCQSMQERIDSYEQETGRLDQFYTDRLGTQLDRMTRIQQGLRAIATEFRSTESIDYTTNDIGERLIRFSHPPLVGGYPISALHRPVEVRAVPGGHRLDRWPIREGGAMTRSGSRPTSGGPAS